MSKKDKSSVDTDGLKQPQEADRNMAEALEPEDSSEDGYNTEEEGLLRLSEQYRKSSSTRRLDGDQLADQEDEEMTHSIHRNNEQDTPMSDSEDPGAAADGLFFSGADFARSRLFPDRMMQVFPQAAGFFSALSEEGGSSAEMRGLVDALARRESPYVVLETLHQISDRLLMSSGYIVERGLPAGKLSRALVQVMSDPDMQEELEVQVVACRCMYNLLEVSPEHASVLVGAGAVEAIQPKLMEVSYIDLAEQCLQTLEVLSRTEGRRVLRTGCLVACLQYLDFFTLHAQRKALVVAANSCKDLKESHFALIQEVFPVLSRVAVEYSDPVAVENAFSALCGVFRSLRNAPDLLEQLVEPPLVSKMCSIIAASASKSNSADSSSVVLSFSTATQLLSGLASVAAASPCISLVLIRDCGYFFNAALNRASGASDVLENSSVPTVSIEALTRSPKELLIKILNLICALMPVVTAETAEFADFKLPLNAKKAKVNVLRMQMYKAEAGVSAFLNDIVPLLVNIYSTTVDFEVRRRVLVGLLRAVHLPHFKTVAAQNVTFITTLLTSIVIQSKEVVPAGKNTHVLLLGALLVIEHCGMEYEDVFVRAFSREGLWEILNGFGSQNASSSGDVITDDKNDFCNDTETDSKDDKKGSIRNDIITSDSNDIDNEGDYNEQDDNEGDDSNDEPDYGDEEEEEEEEEEIDFDNVHEDPFDDASDDAPDEEASDDLSDDAPDEAFDLPDNSLNDVAIGTFNLFTYNNNQLVSTTATILTSIKKTILHSSFDFPHIKYHQQAVEALNRSVATEPNRREWDSLWLDVAASLHYQGVTISSYELTTLGLIPALCRVFSHYKNGSVCYSSFVDLFVQRQASASDDIPLALLVNKLQEALSRSECFEIATSGTSVANKTTAMARQVKLHLVTEDPELPESYRSVMLATQAIATFRSIHSFLKNRILAWGTEDSNWHLEFTIAGEAVPLETTIYGAVYKALQNDPLKPTPDIWTQLHAVGFRKVNGAVPEAVHDDKAVHDKTAVQGGPLRILELLKLLFTINSAAEDSGANELLFVNWKLTAKLNRQLEEPLVVVSGTLPGWCVYVTQQFPFLFPMSTRMFFLQSTSFGYSRVIQQWMLRSTKDENGSVAAELGRPNRHKIRISRSHVLQSGIKLLDLYGAHPSVLEIEYFGEEGSGLGPTLEFYSSMSREFCKKSLGLWRYDNHDDAANEYVHYSSGLFPAPMDDADSNKVLKLFTMLGKMTARALLDSRIVDFAFNKLFFEIANLLEGGKTSSEHNRLFMLAKVSTVDKHLASSLSHLQKYVNNNNVDGTTLEDLSITFTLPGYPQIPLVQGGDDILVDVHNVEEYIDKVIDMTVGNGVHTQIQSFINGFSLVFPYTSMTIFTPSELVSLFGNGEEDWSLETLRAAVHADHGYSPSSPTVVSLLEIMAQFNKLERRSFLQFLTGSPRLPIGGFASLRPEFTVVRKPSEKGFVPDDYLPSVMTCANYLKLPEYSSKEKLRERLAQSISEGLGAFLLS